MGWRNWWSMFGNVDQAKMELSYTALTERRREAVGRPGLSSFADLGYVHAGLDDAWQDCGAGVNGSAGQDSPDRRALLGRAFVAEKTQNRKCHTELK